MTESAANSAPTFKRKKSITLSTLKFVVDKPLYVLILGKLHEGKARVGRSGNVKLDSDGNPRKPPTLVEVIDLQSGEISQIIASTIIKTELTEAYPNDSYLGCSFEIIKQKRKEGREYDPYSIAEVETPDAYIPVANEAKAKASAAPGTVKDAPSADVAATTASSKPVVKR